MTAMALVLAALVNASHQCPRDQRADPGEMRARSEVGAPTAPSAWVARESHRDATSRSAMSDRHATWRSNMRCRGAIAIVAIIAVYGGSAAAETAPADQAMAQTLFD